MTNISSSSLVTPFSSEHFRCWCEVDFRSIQRNLTFIRKHIGPHPQILSLVKANAYGHGLLPVAQFLSSSDCQALGCAHVEEALYLRENGITLPIVLFSGYLSHELPDIISNSIDLTISSANEIKEVSRIALKLKQKARVHLKVDTGMGRLGCPPSEALSLFQKIKSSSHLQLQSFYSHYSSADSNSSFTQKQFQKFQKIPITGTPKHLCNSAGLLAFPHSHLDMVRPGLSLYGISPIPSFQKNLFPALSWKAKIAFIKTVSKGTPLSYGCTYVAKKKMKVATVTVGYGDGFFRALSNKAKVLIQGKKCPVVGTVTMDQILVDISSLDSVRKGATVTLIGKQKKASLSATELADWAQTIPYEIWTHITDRVPRFYI